MSFKESDQIETPNDDTIVWRYMNIDKIFDLLKTKEIYFRRIDRFPDDPHEGIPPNGSEFQTQNHLKRVISRVPESMGSEFVNALIMHRKFYNII
jgi:hypothetical protein